MGDEGKQSATTVCCEACGMAIPAYDVVNYGSIEQGYRELCTRCFNAEVASALGLERFENVRLHPVVLTDCAGESHEFPGCDYSGLWRPSTPSSSQPVRWGDISSKC